MVVLTTMDGNMPDEIFVKEVDGRGKTEEYGVCLKFEMDIQKRISHSRNGYLFSKDNA